MAMEETMYMVYNQDQIRLIGSGRRKIFVKESKKFAYIRDNFDRRVRMKIKMWNDIKEKVVEKDEKTLDK